MGASLIRLVAIAIAASSIHGSAIGSRTGKTFLIEYLSKRILPQTNWQTGVLAFTQSYPDFRPILEGIEDALTRC